MSTNEEIAAELKHLATKEDVALVRVDVGKVRTDVEKVRTDFEKALREQLKWIILLQIPTWTALIGIICGLIFKH